MATSIRNWEKKKALNFIRESGGKATDKDIREWMEDTGIQGYTPSQITRALSSEGLLEKDGRYYYLADENNGDNEEDNQNQGRSGGKGRRSGRNEPEQLQEALQRLMEVNAREREIADENVEVAQRTTELAQEAKDLAEEEFQLCRRILDQLAALPNMKVADVGETVASLGEIGENVRNIAQKGGRQKVVAR